MIKIPSHPFVLVDGSSYLFRAFHALPPLITSKGQPTGALYGVINMIRKLINDYQPEYMAVVFDPKGKTFREDLYPDYKSHRPPMAEDLSCQIAPLFTIVQAMGIPLIVVDNYEADDVIGTLAKQATQLNLHTLISTGDKDMAQLVNPQVTLINTMSNTILDEQGVKDKWGISPQQIIDYLTLMGDSVDNIPGIPNVGPKTAAKWLAQYGNLDTIIKEASNITGKVGENLRNHLAHLPLAKQLVTLDCDVPLQVSPLSLKIKPQDNEQLIILFKKYEFKSWLNDCLQHTKTPLNTLSNTYHTLLARDEFESWITRLQQAKLFAFDTETTDLNPINAKLVGVSFAINTGEAAYVPVGHDYEGAPIQLPLEYVLEKLKPLLEDPTTLKIGHNLKYDISVLANYDIHMQGIGFDTLLEAYISSSNNRLDLDTLALKYLGHHTTTFEDIAGKGAKQLHFNQITLEAASPYAAEDADVALSLHHTLWPVLEKESGLRHVFENIEMPLVKVLATLERTGVLINSTMLAQQSQELAARLTVLEEKVWQLADSVFNLSSPKQLQEILYDKLGLPILQKTPTGQPSTAESALQELAYQFPIPKLILEYRSLSKLKSTYTDTLPQQVNPKTGRVHTSYHQAGAATGRFSSTNPNLQNIPVRTEEGRKIRQAFIAPPRHKIISADYSQIELRIMAHLSKDKGLIEAFKYGLDIHKATAAEVFGLPLDKVDALARRSAKAINFGLIYGMSSFGLAKQLEISRDKAQAYIELYFSRYPQVKHYMQSIRQNARQQGYVETLFGRRLYLPEIASKNLQRQKAAERTAVNAPMQGTAADIIKMAMVKVAEQLNLFNNNVRMIMQVHDELVFEADERCIPEACEVIRAAMASAAQLSVPLVVDIGIGNNWDEAHSLV